MLRSASLCLHELQLLTLTAFEIDPCLIFWINVIIFDVSLVVVVAPDNVDVSFMDATVVG